MKAEQRKRQTVQAVYEKMCVKVRQMLSWMW